MKFKTKLSTHSQKILSKYVPCLEKLFMINHLFCFNKAKHIQMSNDLNKGNTGYCTNVNLFKLFSFVILGPSTACNVVFAHC